MGSPLSLPGTPEVLPVKPKKKPAPRPGGGKKR